MEQKPTKLYFNQFINSSVLYLCAFILLYLVTQVATALISYYVFHIPVAFHNAKIIFPISDYSGLWHQTSVVGIYSVTPIVLIVFIITSIIYFFSYFSIQRRFFKMFLIWIYVQAVNIIFGGLAVGILLKKGIGYVPRWLYTPFPVLITLVVLGLFLLIINGILISKYLTLFGFNIEQYTKWRMQVKLKFSLFFAPILVVNTVLFILGLPDNTIYERILLIVIILQALPVLVFNEIMFEPHIDFSLNNNINRKIIVYAVILLVLYFIAIKNELFL